MKKNGLFILLVLFIVLLFIAFSSIDAKPRHGSIGFFYTSLSPYGEWIELDVDLIVWRPFSVHRHWKPYTIGRWTWTKYGWYWDSYEPFGWATYHYGRWFYDDYYGWIWIPDSEWGPAWVEWRYDDYYIGWAPLPPYASFRIDVGIHFSIGWHSHYSYWNFVSYDRFCDHRVHRFVLDSRRVYKIFGRTKYRNNYYYDRDWIVNGGLERSYIERKGGYRVAEREIYDLDDYRKFDSKNRRDEDRVLAYRPSERDLNIEREIDRTVIKRGERKSSIDRERIIINRGDKEGRTIERISPDRTQGNKREEGRVMPQYRNEERNEPRIEKRVEPSYERNPKSEIEKRDITPERKPELNRNYEPKKDDNAREPRNSRQPDKNDRRKSGNERKGSVEKRR